MRRWIKRIVLVSGGLMAMISVGLYGVLPPLLDQFDGAVLPATALPEAVALPGAAVPTTRFLARPEGRIAYDVQGDETGQLVVCLPSLGDLRQEYRYLVPQLVAAGFRVVTVDLRGQGESSAKWAEYSAAAVGADLVALLHELGAGPAYIIGTSLSAGAVVWAAAEAPTLIAGQILIGPFVRDLPVGLATTLTLKVAFGGPWAAAAWGLYYQSLYPGAKPADLATYRGALKANLREPGRLAALRGYLASSKADCAARLGQVQGRTLVVMGSADPDFPDPAAEAQWLTEQLHGQQLIVQGAGHYPHAERPAEVGPAIISFLRQQ